MNSKFSGRALALFGMVAITACAPENDAYSQNNRIEGRQPKRTSATEGSSLDRSAPSAQNSSTAQKSMAELEAEELGIRNNTQLSPTEKQLELQRIWKEQRDLISLRTTSPQGAPANSDREQSSIGSAANPTAEPTQSETQKQSVPEDTQKSQPATGAKTSAPNPAPAARNEEPKYATKVPGKNGWIKSPYDGKILDAAGIPPGTRVKDPDSGKIMLVP
jgi:hypothetical protein